MEISLLAIAMILLLAPKDRRLPEAITMILLATAGRILMSPLPNVQPVTVLVMLTAIRLGAMRGASLGILTAYLSNVYLGGGAWTIVQALSWGSIGLLTGIISSRLVDDNNELCVSSFCGFSILAAFVFGLLVSLPLILDGGMTVWLAGIPFDLLHAIGNITIAVWTLDMIDDYVEVRWKWVRPDLNRGLTAPAAKYRAKSNPGPVWIGRAIVDDHGREQPDVEHGQSLLHEQREVADDPRVVEP